MFCGRVYIFMFQSFPLGDKSSVNLRGNFHVENITTFEDFLKDSQPQDEAMQVDGDDSVPKIREEPESDERTAQTGDGDEAKDGKPKTLDVDTLYPVFWSLQHSFSNPPRLFEEDHLKQFQQGLEATLAKFKEVPKVIQAGNSERKKGQVSKDEGEDYDAFASSFNPKYLTSRDLFRLEASTWWHCHSGSCAMTT